MRFYRISFIRERCHLHLFVPFHANEISLQKRGLNCVSYTIFLVKSPKKKKKKNGRDQHFQESSLGGFSEVSVTRVRKRICVNLNLHGPYVAFCKLKKGEEISGICILRTASRSNNNNSSSCIRGPSQNVALGSFTSCSGRRRKVQTCVMLMKSCCFAHKGWIHLQHTRKAVAFACRNLRPRPHVSGYF